jgi:hypothetical protein
MRPCNFVCIVLFCFLIVDQFYNGFNDERLVIAGVVLIAVVTECWFLIRRYYRRVWAAWLPPK